MAPKQKSGAEADMEETKLRIAIVNADRCKPKKCRQDCKRSCPVVRTGKMCIEVEPSSKVSYISEPLCIGCGICVKKCPFEAIMIVKTPKDMATETTHRFGPNSFKLHRLPLPRLGQALGLVGTNGIGKSTALNVLSGKLKPNLGRFNNPPEWSEILTHFRGSELQAYFTRILEGGLKVVVKLQYVDKIPKITAGKLHEIIAKKGEDAVAKAPAYLKRLQLDHLIDREVKDLSGGELQRFAILTACISDANIFMFDEPSSYLDIQQRLSAAQTIRGLLAHNNYVICVEHDLSILDYLSDYICCLWGEPSAYGVITTPFSVKEGINLYLDGYIPTENMRFRAEALTFKISQDLEEIEKRNSFYEYPALVKTLGTFKITVSPGSFSDSEIVVLLGQNGTGKTTFIRMLAGLLAPDNNAEKLPKLSVSYKPQTIAAKFEGTVEQLLQSKIPEMLKHSQFITDVTRPLKLEPLLGLAVQHLSGGELQRVALILALGKPADIYLLDEPSAYLDCEQRIEAARAIKRYILHSKRSAFIVEHDFIMATYLADKVIVYEGSPGIDCVANTPQPLVTGMNKFLGIIETTFRRDPVNFRPRINKGESVKDREQKLAGNYFVVDAD